mmetsp:Transcript_61618/g.175024  ORF Transcript_61618/g.175024 Transcript_61618/m.175024 type:complete len:269 (-) Transcript_61618:1059-1865(-)
MELELPPAWSSRLPSPPARSGGLRDCPFFWPATRPPRRLRLARGPLTRLYPPALAWCQSLRLSLLSSRGLAGRNQQLGHLRHHVAGCLPRVLAPWLTWNRLVTGAPCWKRRRPRGHPCLAVLPCPAHLPCPAVLPCLAHLPCPASHPAEVLLCQLPCQHLQSHPSERVASAAEPGWLTLTQEAPPVHCPFRWSTLTPSQTRKDILCQLRPCPCQRHRPCPFQDAAYPVVGQAAGRAGLVAVHPHDILQSQVVLPTVLAASLFQTRLRH